MSSKLQAAQKTDDNAIFPHSPTGVSLAGRDALLRGRLFRGGLLRLWFGLGVLPAVLLTWFGLARALRFQAPNRANQRSIGFLVRIVAFGDDYHPKRRFPHRLRIDFIGEATQLLPAIVYERILIQAKRPVPEW